MGIQHPDITLMEQQGHLSHPEIIGKDIFGFDVYAGDDIYKHDDDIYLVDYLDYQAREILERMGAERTEAR